MTECPNCGKQTKTELKTLFGLDNLLKIVYCPKCEICQSTIPPISIFRGKALRGIDKKTDLFRLKITRPEEQSGTDIMVKITPSVIVTKPSEFRYRGSSSYMTKEKTKKIYPELKRGDLVIVTGFFFEGSLIGILMRNATIGMTYSCVEEQIKLRKGIFSSFHIKNPLLVESEKLMNTT